MALNLAIFVPGRSLIARVCNSRPTASVLVASGLTLAFTSLLVATVIWRAVHHADAISVATEERLLAHTLREAINKVSYDQEGVAIWDDAIVNIKTKFDEKWIASNVGTWMADYFGHDEIQLRDSAGRMIYNYGAAFQGAMREAPEEGALRDLITELRSKIANGALDAYESGKTRVPRVAEQITWRHRPAIVSIMPIVTDTGEIEQQRGSEYLLIDIAFLDGSFVGHQSNKHNLTDVRFSSSISTNPAERSFPISNETGGDIGYFIWTPDRPGREILTNMLPAIALGVISVALVLSILIRNLRGIYSRLQESELNARRSSRHDSLTGLPNRAYFEERLQEALDDPQSAPVALLFLDLDRFKQVNDTLGHPAGDTLIQAFGRRVAKLISSDGFFARLGGDEFAIILPKASNRTRVEALCAEIHAAASMPFWLSTSQALVSASLGISFAEQGTVPKDLTRKADIALYHAKNSGRNRSAFYSDEMSAASAQRQQLEVDLRAAVKSGQGLSVVYQPVYDAKTLEMSGMEALVRWNNPRVGAVSPAVFVDIAEDCGLIDALGLFVLREACAVAASTGIRKVAVNAAAAQFQDPGFADTVLRTLEEAGLAPERLELELTERTLLDASASAKATLDVLRSKGIKIALDDFGTGYSSLSYLMQHTVDRLKIDRSFTILLGEPGPASSVVPAIIAMAHAMGIDVTAEGVETETHAELLKIMGCNDLQGFYLSKPVPAAQLNSPALATVKVA